jgi:hypothetical protein
LDAWVRLGDVDIRRDTSTSTTTSTVRCLTCNIKSVAQIRQICHIGTDPIGDVPHTLDLIVAGGQGRLQYLAQIAGTAVRCVIRGWPEGDWL